MVERVKALIVDTIKANGQREITGDILQDVLLEMLTTFGEAINEGGADSHWHDNKAVLDLFRFDDEGNVYIDRNFYSMLDVSAYGKGDGGSSGGTDLVSWVDQITTLTDFNQNTKFIKQSEVVDNLTSNLSNLPLSARQGMILKNFIDNIEVGEGGQVVVDWDSILGKPSTFTPSAHTHVISDVTGLQIALDAKTSKSYVDDELATKENTFSKNTAFNKNFGTTAGTVSQGNHTHTFASLTSKPTTLGGYGITAFDVKNTAGLNSDTLALGIGSEAIGLNSVALGRSSESYGTASLSVMSYVEGNYSIGIGGDVYGNNSVNIRGEVYGDNSVAIGGEIWSDNSVAIGKYSYCDEPNTGVLGTKGTGGDGANKWIIPGNLAIGKDTSATETLDVNGVIKATGGNSTNWNDAYTNVNSHIANMANPHSVNKSQVGLSNVDNVKQATKTEFDTFKNLFDSLFELDGDYIKAKKSLYSTGDLSAFGKNDLGGGGGDGATELAQLSDVLLTTPAENQILRFINGMWRNIEFDIDLSNYATINYVDSAISNIDVNFNELFEKEVIGGKTYIKAKHSLYSVGDLSAFGKDNLGGGGTGGGTDLVSWVDQIMTLTDFNVGSNFIKISDVEAKGYATNSRVNAIDTRLVTVEANYTTQSDIDSAIDGIEIGGRNLALNSETPNYKNNSARKRVEVSTEGFRSNTNNVFTISFDYKNATRQLEGYLYGTSGGGEGPNHLFNTILNSNEWNRISLTFEDNMFLQGTWTSGLSYTIRYAGGRVDINCDIRNVKLEKGNKPTSWTPAPEDVQADIDNIAMGGRNLILDSLNRINLVTYDAKNPIQDQAVLGENYRRFRRTYSSGVTYKSIRTRTDEYFTPEKTGYYTYSMHIRPNEFDIELRLFGGSFNGDHTLCKANEWTQISATVWIEAGVRTSLYGIYGDMPQEAVQWIDYNRVSVTSGNRPTDWTPAPEDQVSDWSETDVTSFSYIKNKPTQLSQFTDNIGITSHIANKSNPHNVTTAQIGAVDLTTNQTITGAKTFSSLLIASAGLNTPKVDFGNGFTIEPSGTELVFKYNGVIKQRMLSDGTILATGDVTAFG